jgi:hypothetical protein
MTKLTIEIKEQEHNMGTRVKREHGMDASEMEVQMAGIILDILEAALNRKLLGELWELATGEKKTFGIDESITWHDGESQLQGSISAITTKTWKDRSGEVLSETTFDVLLAGSPMGEMIQVVAEDGVEAASSANRQQQGNNEEEK